MTTLLSLSRSQLLIVDVQERLATAMLDHEGLTANIVKLARIASIIGAPTTISEQYPKGLGSTLPAIADAASNAPTFAKMQFSCGRDAALSERIRGLDRPQVVLCGIESHICVLQTAIDLKEHGLAPYVVVDAVSSRLAESKAAAIHRLTAEGVQLVTVEMAAFEWLEQAGTAMFKSVSPLLR